MTKATGTAGLLDPADTVYANITDVEASSGISAGIRMQSLAAGLVPVFEEHKARREAGYNVIEWRDTLSWIDRAIEVAMFRIENSIKAHHQDVENEMMEKASKR